MIRSLLREFGHILPTGVESVTAFSKRHLEGDRPNMPEIANSILGTLCHQLLGITERVNGFSKMIEQHAWLNANARRLMGMPGAARSRPLPLSRQLAMLINSKLDVIWLPGWA